MIIGGGFVATIMNIDENLQKLVPNRGQNTDVPPVSYHIEPIETKKSRLS